MLGNSAGCCRHCCRGWHVAAHLSPSLRPPVPAFGPTTEPVCPPTRLLRARVLVAARRGVSTTSEQSPLKERALLKEQCPELQFKIAGVSFEGRQSAVQELTPGQAVALVKEPTNEFDSNAVRVQTLGGSQLGYIPRDATYNIKYDTCFGHVLSMGPNMKGLFGASITVRPALPPLTLDLFPHTLEPTARSLSHYISQADCERLKARTCAVAQHRCSITGAHGTECVEQWKWDTANASIVLDGMACVHPQIAAVKRIPQLSKTEYREALWLLCSVNEWKVQDCKDYLDYLAMHMYARQRWTVDVGWLLGEDVDLKQLKAH